MTTASLGTQTRWRRARWLLLVLASVALHAGCQATPSPQPGATVAEVQRTQPQRAPEPAPAASAERHDLGQDERRGGHTLARHVGRTDDDLRDRLKREPQISAASTYTDRPTAERAVAAALAHDRTRINRWLEREGQRPNLTIDYHDASGASIGRSLMRRSSRVVSCSDALVVLRWDGRDGFYVLTSYPEAAR